MPAEKVSGGVPGKRRVIRFEDGSKRIVHKDGTTKGVPNKREPRALPSKGASMKGDVGRGIVQKPRRGARRAGSR